jgi:signal transduction histidine kinase
LRPQLAWAAIGAVAGWTLFLTRRSVPLRGRVLVADVAVGAGFLLLSGTVAAEGAVGSGPALLSLTYPFCPVLSAGAAYGPLGGGAAGLVIGACQLLVRGVNGIPITGALLQEQWPLSTGYVLIGLLFGIVSNLLRRASEEAKAATSEVIAASEREARLAERESMARQIHDSVLQVLALIHKRGVELAESGSPSPKDVLELAEMARDQEVALRGLILREPDLAPQGEASLRTALEAAARTVRDLDVTVSTVGPVWLPGEILEELVAAVREALANVVEHAGASKVAIFADHQDGLVQVTVRDDGVGFQFDEARFRAEGKFGVLSSMRGRVEAMGGQMNIESRPGAGTEIEFQVPVAVRATP